ncbi:thiamine-phosphate kinase [Glycocaulis profundi]|nr:thiamine-phosphate kinase [Glycocaulis profundi]
MSGDGEFGYIARRLAPLAADFEGAFGLTDDAAEIAPSEGCALILTADTLVAGRHFLENEDPATAARKALRANLSDLAAMGARPLAYLTSVVWPLDAADALKEGFADGLAVDQAIFGIHLIGGDTTAADGPWMIGVTAIGEVPKGRAVRRSGARPGDLLMVTGTVGDAGLGLEIASGRLEAGEGADVLLARHRLPEPRVALAEAVQAHAAACIDVSDGLIADAGHVAEASGLGLRVDLETLPLSAPARAWLAQQGDPAQAAVFLATAGDDYELACAVPEDRAEAFAAACAEAGTSATAVGRFGEDEGVTVHHHGSPVRIEQAGFTHF